jgi:hypothetical protein
MLETVRTSETSVTTRLHGALSKKAHLHTRRREDLKCHNGAFIHLLSRSVVYQ